MALSCLTIYKITNLKWEEKIGSLVLQKGWLCVLGQNQCANYSQIIYFSRVFVNLRLSVGRKTKNVRWAKIKSLCVGCCVCRNVFSVVNFPFIYPVSNYLRLFSELFGLFRIAYNNRIKNTSVLYSHYVFTPNLVIQSDFLLL